MRLYATLNSEKGKTVTKGGNDFLTLVMTAGKKRTKILEVTLERVKENNHYIYQLWIGDVLTDKLEEGE